MDIIVYELIFRWFSVSHHSLDNPPFNFTLFFNYLLPRIGVLIIDALFLKPNPHVFIRHQKVHILYGILEVLIVKVIQPVQRLTFSYDALKGRFVCEEIILSGLRIGTAGDHFNKGLFILMKANVECLTGKSYDKFLLW